MSEIMGTNLELLKFFQESGHTQFCQRRVPKLSDVPPKLGGETSPSIVHSIAICARPPNGRQTPWKEVRL